MSALAVVALTVLLSASLFSFRGQVLQSQTSAYPFPTTYLPLFTAPTPSPSPVRTSTPTPSVLSTHAPSSTFKAVSQSSDWVYPNSTKTGAITYSSSDSTDTITDWYQAKINAHGYSVKSFVKTKANDKVLNRLSAVKKSSQITIEISKDPSASTAQITLHIDNR